MNKWTVRLLDAVAIALNLTAVAIDVWARMAATAERRAATGRQVMEFKQFAEGFTIRLCDASDTSPHHDEYPPTGREPRGCPMPGACACPFEADAEAPAVSREAPQAEDEVATLAEVQAAYRREIERAQGELSAENERLRAERTEREQGYLAAMRAADAVGSAHLARAKDAEAALSALRAALADVIANTEQEIARLRKSSEDNCSGG